MNYYIKTFGCQMNEHDSAKMAHLLEAAGHIKVAEVKEAQIILFNTCTVREKSHHKAFSELGKALKLKERKPELIVGITGCVAQEERGELFKRFPDLNIVIGPDQIAELAKHIAEIEREMRSGCVIPVNPSTLLRAGAGIQSRQNCSPAGVYPCGGRGGNDRSVARRISVDLVNNSDDYDFVCFNEDLAPDNSQIKVCESVTIIKGCNNFCTFCIVPFVRGREVSKSPEDIITEINYLTAAGAKEIMLLGQNVNSYRQDILPLCKGELEGVESSSEPSTLPDPPFRLTTGGQVQREGSAFPKLLRRIADETEILRIRYTSPHPKDLSDELIREHLNNPKLCEQIHLPVQSGSSTVLKAMNRNYTREDYIALVKKIRTALPDVAITTDMIVGFPGETDEDFADTLSLMEEIRFDGMFAFKYSTRSGTKAARTLKDDVPPSVKKERLRQVLELNTKIVLQKHEKYVETTQEVLVEGISERGEGQFTGRTRTGKIVNFASNTECTGKLVKVKISWASVNTLRGEMIC